MTVRFGSASALLKRAWPTHPRHSITPLVSISRYAIAVGSVAAALAALDAMTAVFRTPPHVSLLICAVLFTAWFCGVRPALLATGLAAVGFAYFLPPTESLVVDVGEWPRIALFVVVALLVVALTESLQRARDAMRATLQEVTRINEALQAENVERAQAEHALRASETRLQAAIDAAGIGLWDWDLQTGRIIWAGHHERMFGFAPGEFDGTFPGFENRIHAEDRDEIDRAVERAREQRCEYVCEYRVMWPDGSIHWLAGRGRFVYEADQPTRMHGGVIDITERKQAETALRQSELDLADAQRVARLGSWSVDVASNALRWSRELYRIFDIDVTGSAVQYEDFLSRVYPEDRPRVLQVNAAARSGGGPFEVDYRITTRSGDVKYVHEYGYARRNGAGAVTGLFGTAQDVTGRKQAERALNEANHHLRELSRRLQQVQEAERRALTTELHDRVGQNLSALSINLQSMKASLAATATGALTARFDDAQALLKDTTHHIRDVMAELHPSELEDFGLAAALRSYTEKAAARGNLCLIADLPDLADPRLPADVRILLFRAAQEAIHNALKHANATWLKVSLDERNGTIRLRFEDDGAGFELESLARGEAQTWGLRIMRERIESIGGRLELESRLGKGTRVTFEIERP